jgi:hypothetical protein
MSSGILTKAGITLTLLSLLMIPSRLLSNLAKEREDIKTGNREE